MSDTANPAKLASSPLAGAKELDARLKRTDEDRWLATRYAPDGVRRLLVALYLMDLELRRTLATKEPMLGKIRLQWWRETIEQIARKGAIRRHDLAEELAQLTARRRDLIDPINALIDRYDDILDDHLHAGGHQAGGEHEHRHLEAERSAVRLAGLALVPTATRLQLDLLAQSSANYLAAKAGLPEAEARWRHARKAVKSLPASLWPAVLHLAAAPPSDTSSASSPLKKRWRMLRAAITRTL
jgi:hypothetical protein